MIFAYALIVEECCCCVQVTVSEVTGRVGTTSVTEVDACSLGEKSCQCSFKISQPLMMSKPKNVVHPGAPSGCAIISF